MKLLIITQKVDVNDDILGFFHGWLVEFAKRFESIIVICLQKGEYHLPANVKVLSLGKEKKKSRLKYIFNFYKYIWRERKNYGAVFVHMNQEYVLLGGLFWKIFGKKIFMWRNHPHGNFLTSMAVFLSNKVFCTSKYSFTARYKKTILMPAGINTDLFKKKNNSARKNNSILFLARISPVKNPHLVIEALRYARSKGIDFTADFYGNPFPKDVPYMNSLKEKVKDYQLSNCISLKKGIPNEETPLVYNVYEIFINPSPSGMYDKTILEAMACENLVLTSNINLKGKIDEKFLFMENDEEHLAKQLVRLLAIPLEEKEKLGKILRSFVVSNHSLTLLRDKLVKCLLS